MIANKDDGSSQFPLRTEIILFPVIVPFENIPPPPQVLATGLSALYSSLPRKIEVRGDDWHALRREDWIGVSSLVLFMNSLEFCNAVVQVAHPLVQSQLLDYLHNGFLVPVMGPALHKVGRMRAAGKMELIRYANLESLKISSGRNCSGGNRWKPDDSI